MTIRLLSSLSAKKTRSTRGFTLIELLVVIVILGTLAALALGGFQSAQMKSRDSRRKSELKEIGIALEAFYNDHKSYPQSDDDKRIVGCKSAVTDLNFSACPTSTGQFSVGGTSYMIQLPVDPSTKQNYMYLSDGVSYQLYARLENTKDRDVPKASGVPQTYRVGCGSGKNCNYGISSSNTTPATGMTPLLTDS